MMFWVELNNTRLEGAVFFLLKIIEVDCHFPTVTIQKMAKMPFIPDPRYWHSDKRFDAQKNIREYVSMTHRAHYPQEHEIGLPRLK